MHRFRKKSDASTKRAQFQGPQFDLGLPDFQPLRSTPVLNDLLPELPPASNFRTSLILPDLTRRFTLLRTSSGQPLSIEDLRQRFADQRARGAEHQISEEEEEMIIETLGRIRGNANGSSNGNAIHARRGSSGDGHESLTSREGPVVSDSNGSYERSSVRSSNTATSSSTPSASIRSTGSTRSARRYSNNLFGSGRMRDYNYRNQKGGAGQRGAVSVTPTTESNPSLQGNSMYSDHSMRPVTPDRDGSVPSSSVQTSPSTTDVDDRTPVVRSAPLNPPAPYTEHLSPSATEYRLAKALNPAAIKRASLAMEEVLKEIEEEIEEDIEETEDEIVMPRSPPLAARSHHSSQSDQSPVGSAESPPEGSQPSSTFEAGTAISSDKHISSDAEVQRASPVPSRRSGGTTSPTPRLPGYIPGMPRPMTPRDPTFDSDDQSRSHSTTPRPTSPLLPGLNGRSSPHVSTSIVAGLMRRDSHTRNTNTAFSYDEQRGSADITMEDALSSPLGGGRRRPASPLAGPAFQPMAVSSRPGTPSNVTWNTSTSSFSSKSRRSRGGSMSTDESGVLSDQSAPVQSLRSSVMPDSPTFDRGHSTTPSATYSRSHHAAAAAEQSMSENRSSPAISSFELGSPIAIVNRTLHSPTPTQNRSSAPQSMSNDLSANSSRRTSRQNGPSSPFSLAPSYPLVFSPMANSSRSSIASEGSSYHSDDGSRRKDRDLDLFVDIDTHYSAWHDVSSTEMTSPATHGDSQDEYDAEDIINRYAGLTKSDFIAIQEKLVNAAVAKAATPDPRDRAPSLRRRRPSTSQSNYSLNGRDNRVTSPPPQAQAQNSNSSSSNTDNAVRSKILESVVDSIKTSSQQTNNEPATPSPQQPRELSPSSRRNRDLARALFGGNSQDASPATLSSSDKSPKMAYHHPSPSSPALVERSPSQTRLTKEDNISGTSPASPYPASLSRNLTILKSPRTPVDQTELAREVQRKTEAATASLKRGPSTKYLDTNASTTSISLTRKRIAPHQISAPHLVSASTSVDTIPLRSPSVASGNPTQQKTGKLGQRLRKWGTLRAKPTVPNGDEITPFPLDAQSARSPPSVQHAHYNTSNINIPEAPATASFTEPGRSKVPLPSPPATTGPGLKGFMSRFRRPRTADTASEFGRRSVDQDRRPQPQESPAVSPAPPGTPLNEYVFPRQSLPQSAPAIKSSFQSPVSRVAPPSSMQSTPPTSWNASSKAHTSQQLETTANPNDTALKQLFDAASNLGLDQTALNDLLARSGSTSSKSTAGWNMLTRNNSAVTNSKPATQNDNPTDRARSPTSDGRPSLDERRGDIVTNNVIPRKRVQPTQALPDDNGANAIVRRTIIFPSDSRTSTIDLNILMRKNSQSARRRQSAGTASVTSSSRSVHDRAPTPPPPRSPTGRRFSHDASPPVPQLPASFSAQAESLLPVSTPRSTTATPIEKSSSAYDSLYEMYAGERAASAGLSDNETSPNSHLDAEGNIDLSRAVEVIELANGEAIWSIVNGLRDEDAESLYASRTSFASDYSMQQPHADGVQVLFKEHTRTGSKGSNSSFLSRKRHAAGKNRPETKVFYSSSNQIGRLIENLSEGQEAGSFNFKPTKRPGHSNSSSFQSENDMHWTVEERLEHLLGSMGNP